MHNWPKYVSRTDPSQPSTNGHHQSPPRRSIFAKRLRQSPPRSVPALPRNRHPEDVPSPPRVESIATRTAPAAIPERTAKILPSDRPKTPRRGEIRASVSSAVRAAPPTVASDLIHWSPQLRPAPELSPRSIRSAPPPTIAARIIKPSIAQTASSTPGNYPFEYSKTTTDQCGCARI